MVSKTALVTGCSEGGIGDALARELAKAGFRVFATARNESKMATLTDLPNITTLVLDPTSSESVKTAFDKVSSLVDGKLDILYNNAGQTIMAPTLDFDIETAQKMYDINLWGALRVTQTFAPLVIAARGTLVYTSSISSICRTPYLGVYAGSKGALAQIVDTLRTELSPFGVRVLNVMTGAVSSRTLDAGKDFQLPEGSIYKPIESQIAARARGEDGVQRLTPADYAQQVVKDVLRETNGSVFRGGLAGMASFMASYMPTSLWDTLAAKGCGLENLKP